MTHVTPRSRPSAHAEPVTAARRQREDSPYARTHADFSLPVARTTHRSLPSEDRMR